MTISRRRLISTVVPLTASLMYRPAWAVSGAGRSVEALRGKLKGKLYAPTDSGYDIARRGLGSTPVEDRFPALVVQPNGPEDIARTLEFARKHGLEISVRSGGHDTFGASTTPTGVVIDLSEMSAISVDAATGIARAGAGARASMLNAAGSPYGLVPVLGTAGHVGLGGLTLGGGIGWLCGSHGATVDNLLGVEMVTADGRLVRASAQENPDLFWALRGGGGNFGVATSFTYQMQRVAQVLAGKLTFKTDAAPFLRFMRDFLAQSPDELDLVVIIPVVSPQIVNVALCWSGSMEAGERTLAALKAFSAPVVDTVKMQSYSAFVSGAVVPFENQYWRGGEFDGLSDKAIDAFSAILERGAPESCMISALHYMHGALCRTPAGSTPFIRQSGHILYYAVTTWAGANRPPEKVKWVQDTADQLRAVNSEQTYINYLSYEGAKPIRDAFGPHFGRLSAIKRKYDPQNLFHNNRNIKA
jgi:FAD/FMN-containing dehydrogenase